VLETVGVHAEDPGAWAGWLERVQRMRERLAWPQGETRLRPHPGGAALAFAAPVDQLYTATEVNEWALLAACGVHALHAPGHPASWDEAAAHRTLALMAAGEANPRLRDLVAEATARALPVLADDDALTLGMGVNGRTWPVDQLPTPGDVDWLVIKPVPTALVTGSNGKTTTVRLLAAMLRAQGLAAGHSCTDGVFVAGDQVASGDYSGPGGARTVLRDPRVQAAVLETARGGLLRRGLAVTRANAAAVTNISADHFGEYGICDVAALADAKLTVARALGADGLLVVNADDEVLAARAKGCATRYAWFAREHAHPALVAHRELGETTCGVRDGVLQLDAGGGSFALADIATMPLAAGGHAAYNIGNAAAASLLAHELGVPPGTISAVLARFGSDPADNPGRLERWAFGGLRIFLDYAHNPDGLRGLLRVARADASGRLGLLLGQAGNRGEPEIRALAAVAAAAKPDRVVLKDIDGYLRGRDDGEVAAVLGDELLKQGMTPDQLRTCLPELGAARELLAWSQPGDVLVMPVHALTARAAVQSLLDHLAASGWLPGDSLPEKGDGGS
jgi:UDP-N-acetylmuramyl tripeptide synthase